VLDSFEKAWRSQTHGKKENVHTEIENLLAALDRERKQSRTILTICASYTLVSLIGGAFVFSRNSAPVSEVWPLIAAQVLALLVLAQLVRTRLLKRHPSTASVRDSTAAALHEMRSEISSLKLFAVAMAAMLVLLALAVSALFESGKMDARSVSSFASVVLMIVIFNGCYLWLKWKRKLQPRRNRLARIMKDLDLP
jgi:uncharacterized membrane protein